MALFNIALKKDLLDDDVLHVGFGEAASNGAIVLEVAGTLAAMKADGTLKGGGLLKINGPASLPVAFALAHAVLHIYGAVAVWDPKLTKYVVVVCHGAAYAVGDLID